MSMAIDRRSLIDNLLQGAQIPAQWFGHPGITAAPTMATHPELGVRFDPEAARAELQSYLDETGQTVDQLDIIVMSNNSSLAQRVSEATQQMWATNLGLNVQLVNQEWAVFLASINSLGTPQVFRVTWCYDYPDENNFVREVFAYGGNTNATDSAGNPSGGVMWKNDTFEQLVADAARETDPTTRVALYARAEEILVDTDAVIIPLYWSSYTSITKPYVLRPSDAAALHEWDILPH
jgi:oligopeptide transport system substrate-binding protein